MPNRQLNFPRQDQEQDNWCWAAVTRNTDHFYDEHSLWSQCLLANDCLQQKGCCKNGGSSACDKTYRTRDALARVGRLHHQSNQAESWATCDQEIMAERPLGARINDVNGNGHAITITGVGTATNRLVTVDDPTWGHRTMVWDELVSNYLLAGGQWVLSWFTNK